jgi:hypothetical protein
MVNEAFPTAPGGRPTFVAGAGRRLYVKARFHTKIQHAAVFRRMPNAQIVCKFSANMPIIRIE